MELVCLISLSTNETLKVLLKNCEFSSDPLTDLFKEFVVSFFFNKGPRKPAVCPVDGVSSVFYSERLF